MGIGGKISAAVTAAVMALSAAVPSYAYFVFDGNSLVWYDDVYVEEYVVEETPIDDTPVYVTDINGDIDDVEVDDVEEDVEEIDSDWSNPFPRTDYEKFTFLEAYDDGIKVGIKNSDVSSCKFYLYDKNKKKYVLQDTCEPEFFDNLLFNGSIIIGDLKAGTTYKFKLVSYGKNGKKIRTEYLTAKTLSKAPHVVVKNNGKNAVITWTTTQKNASGYEVYKRRVNETGGTVIYLGAHKYNLKTLENDGFKLSTRKSTSATGKITVKDGKNWEYSIRTFKVVDGKRVYSGFSTPIGTESPEAYLNNRKLVSKNYSSGDELKLVKKYVAQVTTKNMSNAEKLKAIFDLCNSHGEYQNDITKIDGNRPVWQLMVKGEGQCATWAYALHAMLEYAGIDVRVVRGLRSSGQQHFWCQIKLDGSWYDLDAHLGAYLTKYDGDYIGYVIQDYSD